MQHSQHIASAVEFVDTVLSDELWHTTSCERYTEIVQLAKIMVNPEMPDESRHKTANGPVNYPYVRHLGGVSLFDFARFGADHYEAQYPLSSWRYFVPTTSGAEASIWIKLDRSKLEDRLIDAQSLLAKWKAECAYSHTLMPLIEAAHIGDIPQSCFASVLRVAKTGQGFLVAPEPKTFLGQYPHS